MKKVFISILLFYLIFHFIIPCLYYFTRGFVNEYYNFYDIGSAVKGFLLNFIAIAGTIIVIQFLPNKKQQIEPIYDHATKFFIIAFCVSIIPFILFGGYEGAKLGVGNSTFFSYLILFFNFSTALLFAILLQKKTLNIFFLLIIYICFLTFSGSRSAVIFIFLLVFMIPMFSNSNIYKKVILRYLKLIIIISPFLFILGTSKRLHTADDRFQKIDYISDRIIGRISFLELNMIAIGKADNSTADMALFNKKFGVSNQLKQMANTISPFDFFKFDVDPNQYFRAIFLGKSEKDVPGSYWSVNLTLPVYYYLKTGFIFSCLISILILSSIYLVWVRFSKNIYILILVLMTLYQLLYFFDWVVIFRGVFTVFLTIFTLNRFEFFGRIIARTFKFPLTIKFKKIIIRYKK